MNNDEKQAINSLRDIGMSKTNHGHEDIYRNWGLAYGTETTKRALDQKSRKLQIIE